MVFVDDQSSGGDYSAKTPVLKSFSATFLKTFLNENDERFYFFPPLLAGFILRLQFSFQDAVNFMDIVYI